MEKRRTKGKNLERLVLKRGKKDYLLYKNDIQQENRKSCILYLIASLIAQAAVMFSRLALNWDVYLFAFSLSGTVYSLLLLLFFPKLIKKVNSSWVLPLLYLIQIPTFVIAILNGCLYIGDSYAFSFYIISFMLPLFVFDIPLRVMAVQTVYCICFLVTDYFCKSFDVFAVDAVHLSVTYVATISAILLILSLRYTSLENYVSAREKSEHHEVTGLKNKYALKKDRVNYFGKDIIVCMIDIDDFKFFNDMYGHQIGDAVLKELGGILKRNFGDSASYSFGGDEFLIVYQGKDEEGFKSLLEQTKRDLKNLEISGTFLLHPTLSAGFVYGKATTKQEFQEMINTADFTLYDAKGQGKDIIFGKPCLSNEAILSHSNEKKEIRPASSLDALTKLMTFQTYLQSGQRYLDELKEKKHVLVCYIDVLNFKAYNSAIDCSSGDHLLIKVAELLKSHFPLSLIARISADHFAMICNENEFAPSFEEVEKDFAAYVGNSSIKLIAGCALVQENMNLQQTHALAESVCASLKLDSSKTYRFYSEA